MIWFRIFRRVWIPMSRNIGETWGTPGCGSPPEMGNTPWAVLATTHAVLR